MALSCVCVLTTADENAWREAIRLQLEQELDRRVREALETPPPHDLDPDSTSKGSRSSRGDGELRKLNAHIHLDLTDKEKEYVRNHKWRALQAKRRIRRLLAPHSTIEYSKGHGDDGAVPHMCSDQLAKSNQDSYPGVFGLYSLPEGIKTQSYYSMVTQKAANNFGDLNASEKHEFYYAFTRTGFREAMGTGQLPDGSDIVSVGGGKYTDKYGIVRNEHGPFWPPDYGPLYPAQSHVRGQMEPPCEPLIPPEGADGEYLIHTNM